MDYKSERMKKLSKTLVGIFYIVVFVCVWLGLLVFIPLAAIWSINTLFGLGVAYTAFNWLAASFLTTIFGSNHINKIFK